MIESYLDGIIRELFVSPVIVSFKLLKKTSGEEDGYIRIKCALLNGDILELAEYIQAGKKKIRIETYSFHWQTPDGKLIKRWDNVEHHREIDTFPCHVHLSDGKVTGSAPMTLEKILAELEKTIPPDID